MRKNTITSYLFAIFGVLFALDSDAASSIFSDYGQIQNVQNYSSSPFWNPNSPYNSTLPRPVYAQGTDLKTSDCLSVVKSLVSAQCMTRDNCKNTTVSDIRPDIMIQLSKLPNHNYVSACSGYIDSAYEEYVKNYGNTLSSGNVSFPAATTPNPKLSKNNTQIENPYKQKTPQWQAEIKERADEIEEYEREMRGGDPHLTPTSFPMTYADFSFSERMKNDAAGLMPYKDMKAYKTLNVKTAEEWCNDVEHSNSPECRAYRNCTDMMKSKDKNVILAEYNNNKTVCEVKQCVPGYVPNKTKNGCIKNPGTDCFAQMQDVPHVTAAQIDENGRCAVIACEQGWHKNAAADGCDKNTGMDCMDELSPLPAHVTAAEKDSNGQCKVKQCETGWTPNTAQNGCVRVTGSVCTEELNPLPAHATVAKIDENGKCKIAECEPGYRPKQPDKDECDVYVPVRNENCIDQITNRAHVVSATVDESGNCIVTCESGWQPKEPDKKECESAPAEFVI